MAGPGQAPRFGRWSVADVLWMFGSVWASVLGLFMVAAAVVAVADRGGRWALTAAGRLVFAAVFFLSARTMYRRVG